MNFQYHRTQGRDRPLSNQDEKIGHAAKARCALFWLFVVATIAFSSGLAQSAYSHETKQPKNLVTTPAACAAHGDNYAKTICLEPYFAKVTQERSARMAIARARQMQLQGLLSDCHLIAHFVGEANLKKHGFNLGKALSTCSTACFQGCIHGAVQTYVANKDSFEEFIAELDTLCDTASDNAWMRRQCIHGVGHGFLTGGFLPLGKAIGACHKFKKQEIETCLGGLFMEHMQANLFLSEQELKQEIPNICAKVVEMKNDRWIRSCYDAIGEGVMFYTGHDLRKSLAFCRLLRGRPRDLCMKAAIYEANSAPLRFDPTACAAAPVHLQKMCRKLSLKKK